MTKTKQQETSEHSDRIGRRTFVKFMPAMGAAGLVVTSFSSGAPAQTPSPSPSPSPSPAPAAPSPLAEAYAEVARLRFGAHIEPGQWERIKRDLEGNVRAADRLREFKLKNADEPDFIFFA